MPSGWQRERSKCVFVLSVKFVVKKMPSPIQEWILFYLRWIIRDMYIQSLLRQVALGEGQLAFAVHDAYLGEERRIVEGASRGDVGRHAAQVIARLRAAHAGIQLFASVAAGDVDGYAPSFAQRVQHLVDELHHQGHRPRRRRIVDAAGFGGGATGEF